MELLKPPHSSTPCPLRVHAPVLITRLLEGPSQHLIVPSFDGFLVGDSPGWTQIGSFKMTEH